MFKSDLDKWYDSLPVHTKEWLKKQPVWYDIDMFNAFAIGTVVGLLIGLIL